MIEKQDQNLEDSTEETNDDEEIESDTQEDEEEGPDMEDFNVGDNCYDFTGVEGDDLFKLFKKTFPCIMSDKKQSSEMR